MIITSFPKFDLITRENNIFSDNTDIETLEPQLFKNWDI